MDKIIFFFDLAALIILIFIFLTDDPNTADIIRVAAGSALGLSLLYNATFICNCVKGFLGRGSECQAATTGSSPNVKPKGNDSAFTGSSSSIAMRPLSSQVPLDYRAMSRL